MLTYHVRQRVFKLKEGEALSFPADGEVRFHFSPGQPFGTEPGGGHTAMQNVAASSIFDANTGKHEIASSQPLTPLDVTITGNEWTARMEGSTLKVTQSFKSNSQLTELIESLYFSVPMLLAVEFADPPIITRVDGRIGEVEFRWELKNWKGRFEITTQEKQEQSVSKSWLRINFISKSGSRRLFAALHYFHVALRLAKGGEVAGEFVPEMVLNLSKVLEVLFPPPGDGKTIKAVRAGLRSLNFSETDIEADYVPAMALRNEIDVGHVDLALFKMDQLSIIHNYVEHAESVFKVLFKRIFEKLEDDSYKVEPYEPKPADGKAVKIVEKMRQHAKRYE